MPQHVCITVCSLCGDARDIREDTQGCPGDATTPLTDDAGTVAAPAINAQAPAPAGEPLPDWERRLIDDPHIGKALAADAELERVLRFITDMPTWSNGDVVMVRNYLLDALHDHAHRLAGE